MHQTVSAIQDAVTVMAFLLS